MWPNMKLLLEKAKSCYEEYVLGNDISLYETQLGLHKEEPGDYNGSLERMSMNRGAMTAGNFYGSNHDE